MSQVLLQELTGNDLRKVAQYWNTHRIRPSLNAEIPADRPDSIYFVPQLNNTCDYLTEVAVDEIDIAEELCTEQVSAKGCSTHFNDLAIMTMEDEGLQMPHTADEAKDLYITLLSLINELELNDKHIS